MALLTRRQVRFLLGVLWLLDAALQAQPALFRAEWWRDDLAQSAMGQPAAINHSIVWAAGLIAHHAAAYNALFVAIEALIGVALVAGRCERLAIALSVPWALGIWWVGEGFGGLPTGFALLAAGAPGAVLLYVLLGFLAWPPSGEARVAPAPAVWEGRAVAERRGVAERPAVAAWVALWAGQAVLHLPWVFPPGQVVTANLEEHAVGQPAWLGGLAGWNEGALHGHGLLVTVVAAVAEVLIGLGVLSARTRRPALAAGVALSLIYWVAVQDLGGLLAGGATDPGAAPLLILVALAMWPRRRPVWAANRIRAIRQLGVRDAPERGTLAA
jgi:hypothetical protein